MVRKGWRGLAFEVGRSNSVCRFVSGNRGDASPVRDHPARTGSIQAWARAARGTDIDGHEEAGGCPGEAGACPAEPAQVAGGRVSLVGGSGASTSMVASSRTL